MKRVSRLPSYSSSCFCVCNAGAAHVTERGTLLAIYSIEQQDAAAKRLALVNRLESTCSGGILGMHHHPVSLFVCISYFVRCRSKCACTPWWPPCEGDCLRHSSASGAFDRFSSRYSMVIGSLGRSPTLISWMSALPMELTHSDTCTDLPCTLGSDGTVFDFPSCPPE